MGRMSDNFIKIPVTFETITPLWTGDAWMENRSIRPSSILGSLRFWFEVMCLARLINNEECKNEVIKEIIKEKGRLIEDFKMTEECERDLRQGKSIYEIAKEKLSLPSYIFGATGWKGLVRIKKLKILDTFDYKYPLGKIEFPNLAYEKEIFNKRIRRKEIKNITPAWYFNEGFYGKFDVVFEIHNEEQNYFISLLSLVEQYGFLGGKWNIGYGRVRIIKPEISNNFDLRNNNFIQVQNNIITKNDLRELIEELIKRKALLRRNESNKEFRHKIFGAVRGGRNEVLPQGSKILPLITKNQEENYHGSFIILNGLLNL